MAVHQTPFFTDYRRVTRASEDLKQIFTHRLIADTAVFVFVYYIFLPRSQN